MIKVDIVKRVGERLKLKDKDALQVVDAIIESMKEVICKQGRLEIRDFGVFQVKERKARIGRNPRNKTEYPISPRKVVTFKIGKELKDHSVRGAVAAPEPLATASGDARDPEAPASDAPPGPSRP